MKNFKVSLGSTARSLPDDLYDLLIEEFNLEISPANGEVPCPWDAEMTISNGTVILTGGVNPSGKGSCICKVPITAFKDLYTLSLWNSDEESVIEIKNAIAKYGWIISEE